METVLSDTVLSLCAGIGLAAACGFRVFVPLLVMSIASHTHHLSLASGFAWIGSDTALIAFSAATLLEIAGYYVPWIDHLLDAVATPAAVIAGTIAAASTVSDMSPFLRWTVAAVAGGGIAGLIQGITVLTRGLSLTSTGGLANPIFATAELGGALLTSVLAVVLPVLTVCVLFLAAFFLIRRVLQIRWKRGLPEPSYTPVSPVSS